MLAAKRRACTIFVKIIYWRAYGVKKNRIGTDNKKRNAIAGQRCLTWGAKGLIMNIEKVIYVRLSLENALLTRHNFCAGGADAFFYFDISLLIFIKIDREMSK